MGRVDGKVAFITGVARGQGRSHAVRLAEEGADIIGIDLLEDLESVDYVFSGEQDMQETVNLVRSIGRRIVALKGDVRSSEDLRSVLDKGVSEFGRLDIVCANAGICTAQTWDKVTPEVWRDTIEVDLTGVWNTMVVSVPHLIASGGGSIIATSSAAGIKGYPYFAPYVAAKHGVVGVVRSLANELARYRIRVNTVHPGGVDTPMVEGMSRQLVVLESDPNLGPIFMNSFGINGIPPRAISDAVLFLASDESQYVTGVTLTVDAGSTIR
jgi:SDR family mycofactocin-dependent oxidoreductase